MVDLRQFNITIMQSSHASSSTNSHITDKALADLEKLTREYAIGTLDTLDGFAKYWNEFDHIARKLMELKIINKAERDLYFWIGLPYALRKSISQKLTTMDVAYHERLIPTWRDTIQAGRHVFNDTSVG